MVNGPPCQVCSWTLRWAPEQNAWVCDRCRAVVPAQPAAQPYPQQGQPSGYPQQSGYPQSQSGYQQAQASYPQAQPGYPPQAGYPPQPGYPPQGQPAHAAVAPPHGKSSKGLWIAIGGAVAVIGIIVVIVVATRGGNETAGDVASGSADKASDSADTSAGTDGYSVMIAKMSGFKDRACACKDKACIDALQSEMVRWSQDQAKNPPKMGVVDEAATKKMTAVMDGYTKCLTEVLVASNGTTTPHAGSAAATPAAAAFAVGDRVMAKWTNGQWYPGKVSAVRADGTYDIHYDDGDHSNALPASHVRKRTATTSTSTSSTSRPAGDAPCPGPGITRRCDGVCVNIQENNNHCGGCNHQCPSGKTCDGHLFCRDAQGNL